MPYQGHYKRKKEQRAEEFTKEENGQNCRECTEQNTASKAILTAGKTENFFTRHVKLLTFLVCLSLFFMFFGPWNISRLAKWKKEQDELKDRMPEKYIEHLIEIGPELEWADFSHYTYKVIAEDYAYIREYHTAKDEYLLLVSAEAEGKKLDSVLLMRRSDGVQWQLLESKSPITDDK